jgi:hypothetical protein
MTTDEQLRPGCPVLQTGRYAGYTATGRLLGEFHLPAGCYTPLIAGVAYFVPVGTLQADC